MPFKSQKIKIEKTKHDRRIKLTNDDKELIKWLRDEEQISYNKLALQFKVSKRTIQFVCCPEKLEENKKRRQERGGTKIYYDKEKHRQSMKEYRDYKQSLYIKGEIKEKPNN